MLGSDKSRGYMLKMICADFLAGENLETATIDTFLTSLNRLVEFLPEPKKREFLGQIQSV
jgi:hypothetical protein